MNRRVVVTGLGVLCGLGQNQHEVWQGLAAGRPGIRPIQQIDVASLKIQQGSEVPGYEAATRLDPKTAGFLDRFAQFGVLAARDAIEQSGLRWRGDVAERTAIVTGSCVGGQTTMDGEFVTLYREGKCRVPPLTIPKIMANAGASQIALEHGITGPTYTVSTACSSSNHALGQAFHLVRSGMVDAAITGGSEAPFSPGLLRAWEAMRVVSPDTCRPFSLDRRGLVLGEGGAMLVLEALATAQARGALILGEVVGFGMSSDAHHITQPSADGAARSIRSALRDGGLSPEQVGYINAHGTGTTANDATETQAIKSVFGAHAGRLLVSSTKSMHGHTLGAAGAIEAAATLLALRAGVIPPTANYQEPDPACDLDVVPNQAREAEVEVALSHSFAFGGLNAVVAFRRWKQ